MKLDTASKEKANSDLRTFLETTDADALVRVVLILDAGDSEKTEQRSDMRPSDFGSAGEYRRALVEQRKSALEDATGDTVEALRQLSLHLVGGEVGRAIVAEGSASQIAEALKLDGVSSAILDRPIDLARAGRRNAG